MGKKIYIIGQIPKIIDLSCEAKFFIAQMYLTQMGFNVVNPINRLIDNTVKNEVAVRKNINDLMLCNAVYIMPCTKLGKNVKNLEIKLALDFNLTIINGSIDTSSESSERIKKERIKRKKTIAN
ncbi:DUF4406 domain-containing protein [Flavobacterium sp.]|uniref:DUF4406 domain-containing protein n=1 Tax=Flavobacterium sp. TaxID=239 RepID=UPI003753E15E